MSKKPNLPVFHARAVQEDAQYLAEPIAGRGPEHHWMLDVCDDLIDYCDSNEMRGASSKLRYVVVAIIRDVEAAARRKCQ